MEYFRQRVNLVRGNRGLAPINFDAGTRKEAHLLPTKPTEPTPLMKKAVPPPLLNLELPPPAASSTPTRRNSERAAPPPKLNPSSSNPPKILGRVADIATEFAPSSDDVRRRTTAARKWRAAADEKPVSGVISRGRNRQTDEENFEVYNPVEIQTGPLEELEREFENFKRKFDEAIAAEKRRKYH